MNARSKSDANVVRRTKEGRRRSDSELIAAMEPPALPKESEETVISKRFHVSFHPASSFTGTPEDISKRFCAFPGIQHTRAVEGFGERDALGGMRGWGWVEIVGSKKGIAGCVATLSGTTWKGAKVRVGDARPDWRERLAAEQRDPAAASDSGVDTKTKPIIEKTEEPKVKLCRSGYRRGVILHGKHARDMEPLTRERAVTLSQEHKGGWYATEMGRVLWSVRMRPEKTLVKGDMGAFTSEKKVDIQRSVVAKRKKISVGRRRPRKRIDMVRWGSRYLHGMWLSGCDDGQTEIPRKAITEIEEQNVDINEDGPLQSTRQILQEQKTAVGLLADMFGHQDENGSDEPEDWVGKESLESDVDEEALLRQGQEEGVSGKGLEAEEVLKDSKQGDASYGNRKGGREEPKDLKELFAPKEETEFSLLDHLGVDFDDLELDDIPFPITKPYADERGPAPTTVQTQYPQPSMAVFDEKKSLFFPSTTKAKGTQDLFDVAQERGWNWRDVFVRSETADEIRTKWEEERGELTRGWKKRWREASRRKGKGQPAGGDE